MNKTAEKIKLARLKKNMTPKQLAKKCGLTANYIEQVESGKKIISESIASKIFKVLEMKPDALSQEAMARREEYVRKRPKPQPVQKVQHTAVDHAPSWSGALDNILRKYTVYNAHTKKEVGVKTIPTLEKKVEGYHCDKISFIEVFDNTMSSYNILEDDILMLFLTKDITNDKIYYFEYENTPYVRKLRKEQNKKVSLYSDNQTLMVDLDKIKLIGKVVKLERMI